MTTGGHCVSMFAALRSSAVPERARTPPFRARLTPILTLLLVVVANPFRRAAAADLEVIFSENTGSHPIADLTLGSDGNLYWTTQNGGASDRGTIFKMTPDGEADDVGLL